MPTHIILLGTTNFSINELAYLLSASRPVQSAHYILRPAPCIWPNMHSPTHPEESCVCSRIACSMFSVFIATGAPLKAKGDQHRTRHTALPSCKRGPAHGFPAQAAQQPASLPLAGEGSWLKLLVENTQTTYSQRGQNSTARQQPVMTLISTQQGMHTHQKECKSKLTATLPSPCCNLPCRK